MDTSVWYFSLPRNFSFYPIEVDIDEVEDFLATDDLFVEYFNVFLALPTFPEPLYFNKETGGFEVVSVAKKELAKKIKEALRSQARTPRIYRVAKKHSYIDIPLIPIENEKEPENQEIHTSFAVTTLNKEQGIHWVKAERLPSFLDSDLYLEYRLSKLLGQSRITGEQGEYVLMKIDYKPRPKKIKKKSDDDEVKIDPKEALMKDLYVCMGNASTTDTDAWYSTAKIATQNETTYTSPSRPTSERVKSAASTRPTSARPTSAYSDPYNRSDSGLGISWKGSAKSTKNSSYSTLYHSKYSQHETEDDVMMSKLFASDGKPAHRITDNLCVVNKDRPYSSIIYSTPKSELELKSDDAELGIIDDDEKDSGKGDDENIDMNDSLALDSEPIVFKNIDDLGSVIVGVVLKKAVGQLANLDEAELEKIPEIYELFPEGQFSKLTVDSLDRVTLIEESKEEKPVGTIEQETEQKISERMKKNMEEESDVDSLLDSEEDYEEEDTFFRKHKFKTYSLCTRKGVDQFKRFLKGTMGEKNWNLWIDVDRMRLMTVHSEIQLNVCWLREKYHKPGAEFELTVEQKAQLGLSEPSAWTMDKLLAVHNQIAEPLVLYWAPRFLLKQMMRTNPDKNLLYHHLKHLKHSVAVDPSPPTASLLPLRPKSCLPRMKPQEPVIAPQIQPIYFEPPETLDTSPPVGLRRTYAEPTMKFIANWQKEQMVHTQLISPRLNVARTSTPRLRRPASAKIPRRTSLVSLSSRPKSAVRLGTRPSTANSTSSRISVESATGRVRIKTPTHSLTKTPSKMSDTPRSRPSSAASSIRSVRSEDLSSEVSDFLGGSRLEHLLQALHHENDSGSFFKKYVDRSGSKMWINNLTFWRDVQAYHMLFYGKNMDPYVVHKKAKSIFSKYIVVGARHHIGVGHGVEQEIRSHLIPPFEELFDEAEEHSLTVIYEAWQEMWETDQKTYNKVELIEVKRHLETKSKYVLNLQKSGLIKERVSTPDVMEGYEDPVYDEALIENIPEEFKDYTLEKLVHNRIELEHFRNFLAENYASMDIMCWMDIEAFRRITHTDEKKRDAKAREIKMKYLNKKYFFGANSPAGKEGQDKVAEAGGGWGKLLEDRPPNPMILEAQKYVRERLEKKWLPLFLVTPDFAVRQRPRQSMDDVVDDVMVQKKRKSLNMLKLLDSKWMSSANEIIVFRKALLNPVTSVQFRRFVSIKGDSLENDVLFWLEVQKFKEMYHSHCEDTMITQKINTIINCFIESQIPPSLQIDIPPEMGERIVDRKYEKCPYLFREAQLVVFRVLFPHWREFCDFRLNLAEEKVLPTIERRRRHARAKERKRQQELEEKQAKGKIRYLKFREAERRAALGLPPLGEEDDVFHDPFKALGAPESVDGDGEGEEKDKISWTYSNYMNALEREELINNTDESSFTSLLTDTASVKSVGTASVGSQSDERKGSKADDDSDRKRSVDNGENGKAKGPGNGSRKSSIDVPMVGERRMSRQSRSDSIQSQHRVTIQDPKSTNNKVKPKV
ncbi:regulator of G-protein signaling 22-like isoform X3 [Ruditapes philippinarum]|uniref:regulator of G-protein signaling 22-like isoform X3 n=1 Tax=Ruditapes philippinarum TaxID=129788 RepID=UPI00295A6322|nr:regulator of G-protein signaling 22-like isoform X3 [Ruditapes philippinarum]